MRKIKIISLIIYILFSFITSVKADEKKKIVVWAMGYEGTQIGKMARRFEKEYPDIKVETQAIPWSAAHEKLLTSIIGDVPPDISQMGTTWIAEFESMEAFEPIDEYLKDSELKEEDFFKSSFGIGKINGKTYGLPWYVDTRVLFYRKDILKEAGYEQPPESWEEFLDTAIQLSKRDGGRAEKYGIALPVKDWQIFLPFLWQNAGAILSEDHQRIRVKEENFARALRYYSKFYENRAAPIKDPGYDLLWAFKEGIYPMFISGPWMISQIRREAPELDGKWGVAMLPGNKTRESFVGGSHLEIFKDSENKDAAWKFIEYMSRPENQLKWFELAGSLPSNKNAWNSGYFDNMPFIKVFGNQMLHTKSPPNVPHWEEIAGIVDKRMEQALVGDRSIESVQRLLYDEIQSIISKTREKTNIFYWLLGLSIVGLAGMFAYIRRLNIKHKYIGTRKKEKEIYEREVPGGMLGKGVKEYYIPIGFIFPAIAVLLVFLFFPIFSSFLISLTDWNIYTFSDIKSLDFIGFKNYLNLFKDKVFWQALLNTFIFSGVGIPLNIILALFIAVIIDKKYIKNKAIFRSGYFMPVVTTLVAVAVIWRWLYNPEYGLINYILGLFGIPEQTWLSDPILALPSLIIMSVWKNFGYNMVIILAGLQTIPNTLYEAASVDGADSWQTFWNITLPSLKSTLFFVVIMTTISSFQFFAEPYIMTKGGPLNRTISMVMYMYNQGFKFFNFGYASAIAYILFVCILAFTLIQLYYRKRLEEK